jgi:lysophosphatidate acyltransferase
MMILVYIGTRHMSESLLPFKLGAFRLAIEAQVPIVPVVFSSYKPLYNVDKFSKNYYWRSGCVTIKCLQPIDTTGMTVENDLQQLTDMTRQRMLDAYRSIRTTAYDQQDNVC